MWAKELVIWILFYLQAVSIAVGEEDEQHTLASGPQTIDTAVDPSAQDVYDYGIGIALSGSYGTISISYSNGTKMNLAKIDGTEAYKAMFKNFSMEASQHIHPPYEGWDDATIDWPRQRQRRWNKDHGLPASEYVGLISTMISTLVTTAQLRLGNDITAALAATPNLIALYEEDVTDAFKNSGLQSLDYAWEHNDVYHETAAAVAGKGFGLCEDFKHIKSCREQERKMPYEIALSVAYTADYLCVELAYVASASYVHGYKSSSPTMDFTLGLSALQNNLPEKSYWEAVKDTILRGMVIDLNEHQPKKYSSWMMNPTTPSFAQCWIRPCSRTTMGYCRRYSTVIQSFGLRKELRRWHVAVDSWVEGKDARTFEPRLCLAR